MSAAGEATSDLDGPAQGAATTGVTTASVNGPLVVGDAPAWSGAVGQVAFYRSVLTPAQVADRWTAWSTTP